MRKKKPLKNDKVCVFRVTLDSDSGIIHLGRINKNILKTGKAPWREIAMLGSDNLYNFTKAIVNSFGFMFDHCFGFYSNWENSRMYFDSQEMYEFFTDINEEPDPRAKPVRTSKVSQAFEEIGKKMLFLFDYGDNWHFIVELKEIKDPESKKLYPVLSRRVGKSPQQYPPAKLV